MNALQAIAQLTNRTEAEIASFDIWAAVILVKFVKGSPKFVSLKKFTALTTVTEIKPLQFGLNAKRDRKKPWVARITGISGDCYRFTREFIEPTSVEWNKKGCVSADFSITEQGIYQDADTGYYRVLLGNGKLVWEEISWQEVQHIMERDEVAATAVCPVAHTAAIGLF
jgi:hypothetical protein